MIVLVFLLVIFKFLYNNFQKKILGKSENSDLKTNNQNENMKVSLPNTKGNLFELKSVNMTSSTSTTTPNFGFSFGLNPVVTSTVAPVTSSSFLSTAVSKSDNTSAPSFSFGSIPATSTANTLNSNFSFQAKSLSFDKPLPIPSINNGFNFSFGNTVAATNSSTENTQGLNSAPFVFGSNSQTSLPTAFGSNGLNANGLNNNGISK